MDTIEDKLQEVYAQIKDKVPAMHCLNFTLSEYDHCSGVKLGGFIHIKPDNCYIYSDLTKLRAIIAREQCKERRREILS